ncbi:coxsackievirus and adenovirus receptor-like [Perca flavescens]|uniref:coxsackievirus and adenovirus receptor-like n=1 Tax=Perca flavescens TaxID=8167 RepID=UPI00106E49B5|nr:coxsackievirus and adenovirus receptor-like [Perca flavescens]
MEAIKNVWISGNTVGCPRNPTQRPQIAVIHPAEESRVRGAGSPLPGRRQNNARNGPTTSSAARCVFLGDGGAYAEKVGPGRGKDLIEITVYPGGDVILPCQVAGSSIRVVEWTRPDLEPDTVLLNSDGHLETDEQNPSFKGRVELVDRDLKGRDASLILKNVNRQDAGTYMCGVKTGDSEPIRIIRLQVPEPADLPVVTVHPGDDVILPCRADNSSSRAVEWTRPDLEPDIVLFSINGHLDPTQQHPSFKDRVELVDRDLKDGNLSFILKNVSRHDTGTYECRVASDGSRRRKRAIRDSEPIRTLRLQVPEPAGSNRGHSEDGNSTNDVPEDRNSSPVGLIVGLAAGVLVLVAAAVVGVLMYRRRKNKRLSII